MPSGRWCPSLLDEPAQRHVAEMIAGADIRYPNARLVTALTLVGALRPIWSRTPDGGTTSVAELSRAARPILLDLTDLAAGLREVVRGWRDRVDVHTAKTIDRPADALPIRPDADIVWAAPSTSPPITAIPALREALSCWLGTSASVVDVIDDVHDVMPSGAADEELYARPCSGVVYLDERSRGCTPLRLLVRRLHLITDVHGDHGVDLVTSHPW